MKTKHPMVFVDWLQLLFIGLKLTEEIDWHWVWVLMPAIIYFAALIVVEAYKEINKR